MLQDGHSDIIPDDSLDLSKVDWNEYPGFAPTGYLQPFQEDFKRSLLLIRREHH
jgi:hypothetical protein